MEVTCDFLTVMSDLPFNIEQVPTDNKQRFWSFDKPKITKNTTKYRANTFGFYPINGKEVVEFMARSTGCKETKIFRPIIYHNNIYA